MIECRILRLKENDLDDVFIENYDLFPAIFNKVDVFEQSFLYDGTEVVDVQVGNEFYLVKMTFKTFKERYVGINLGIKYN